MRKTAEIIVCWNDIRKYYDGKLHSPTRMITKGSLFFSTAEFLIIKNPKTTNTQTKKKHPPKSKNVALYYIPRSLIVKVDTIKHGE